jgi:hypothetical protein
MVDYHYHYFFVGESLFTISTTHMLKLIGLYLIRLIIFLLFTQILLFLAII